MGKKFATVFIAVWRLHASGKYNFEDHLLNVNISMTDEFSQKYISLYLYLGFFFENRKNSGRTPGQNDDPVTRT